MLVGPEKVGAEVIAGGGPAAGGGETYSEPFEAWASHALGLNVLQPKFDGYCIVCGWPDVLPDGLRDQYCIDSPPPPRGDGLPVQFIDWPGSP